MGYFIVTKDVAKKGILSDNKDLSLVLMYFFVYRLA